MSDDGEILMGRWDCDACDTKGVLGDRYECSNCGSARPDDVQFYLPEDAELITDEAGLASANAGPDWQCGYCESWTPAGDQGCSNCGADRAEAERIQQTETYQDASQIPRSADGPSAVGPKDSPPPATAGKASKSKPLYAALGCLFLLLFCCISGALLPAPAPKLAKISSLAWETSQELTEYKVVSRADWTKPDDAFEVASEQKVHHHDKVLDRYVTTTRTESYQVQVGTTTKTERVATGSKKVKSGTTTKNLGNGRFKRVPVYKTVTTYGTRSRQVPRYETRTRQVPHREPVYKQVPVMKTWYRYKLKRWVSIDKKTESGTGKELLWPKLAATPREGAPEIGDLRPGRKTSVFRATVLMGEERKPVTLEIPEAHWREYSKDQQVECVMKDGKLESIRPWTPDQPK